MSFGLLSVLLLQLVLCPVSFTSLVPFFSCPLSNDLLLLHHASSYVWGFLLHFLHLGPQLHRSMTPLANLLIHANGQQHCQHICFSTMHYMLISTCSHPSILYVVSTMIEKHYFLKEFYEVSNNCFPSIIKQLEKRHINKSIVIYKLGI